MQVLRFQKATEFDLTGAQFPCKITIKNYSYLSGRLKIIAYNHTMSRYKLSQIGYLIDSTSGEENTPSILKFMILYFLNKNSS